MVYLENGLSVIESRTIFERTKRTDSPKYNDLRNMSNEERKLQLIAHMILPLGEATCT